MNHYELILPLLIVLTILPERARIAEEFYV